MSAVLVAGGAGYIGSHTVKALVRAGRRVVVYDNLSSGHREAVTGADFVEGDVSDLETFRRALRDRHVDAVLHFAAFLIVSESVKDPIGYYRNNVKGTLAVLEAMATESVNRLVFSS
ncbi:MAG: NAD-dependent epimerase/dehydratase family protein, partial [Acidobacteria bacterium]|nr:NAD-dependent epimerase/dehydratase family protein [Acidobacteriota bacterium]